MKAIEKYLNLNTSNVTVNPTTTVGITNVEAFKYI